MSMYAGLITEDDVDYADDFDEAVWAELKGEADDDQTELLHANPVGWFRALRTIKKSMHHSIAEGRTRIRSTDEDEAGKRERKEQYVGRAARFHIIGKAEERRQYVVRLVSDEGLTTACLGEIVDEIARSIDTLRDAGKDEAIAELDSLAHRLSLRKALVSA